MSTAFPIRRSLAVLLVVAATLASAAGCTVSSGASAVCAFQVTYEGRTYHGVADVDFTVAERLGTATHPTCNDTGRRAEERATETTAYRVEGLDTGIAIAVGASPDDAVLVAVRAGKSPPPEVEKLRNHP